MLVKFKQILDMAEKGDFAVPAFNVYNVETVMGVLAAAEEAKAPVIMQIYPRLIKEESGYFVAPVVLAAAAKASVPICFHLDHGPSMLEVVRSIRYGATGIMIDASTLPFDENVALTKRVVEECNYIGVGVEGEIGHIGTTKDDAMGAMTDPEEAKAFVEQTGVTALAVLVGNAHGRYKLPPKLDIERVKKIRQLTGKPIVLHGGSGIPDDQMQAGIHAGIRKINFSTDLCYSFIDKVGEVFESPERPIAIDTFMKQPIEAVKKFALNKIDVLGARNKA